MANIKNITELPLAESAEGLNLIVNDGGSAKQIAASEVGAQADWAETNENSPAFIKNKPVEEWDLDLTVDITWNAETSDFNAPVFTAAEGYSYDTFVAKVEAGEIPKVKLILRQAMNADTTLRLIDGHCSISSMTQLVESRVVYGIFAFGFDGPFMVILNADGTFTLTTRGE